MRIQKNIFYFINSIKNRNIPILQRRVLSSKSKINNLTTESHPKRFSFKRSIIGLTGVLTLGTVYVVNTNEGLRRSVEFWKFALPVFLHYKYVEFKTKSLTEEEKDFAFNELHLKYSPGAEAVTHYLKGYYLKSAQFVSTMDDFLPEAYLSWCKKLQNEAPSELNKELVENLIKSNLGAKIEDIFLEFDFDPVGCASIGQVYRAVLRKPIVDNVTKKEISEVAVKIQTPGIERRFRSDLSTIRSFCKIAMPEFLPPLDEIEANFKTEFNFELEAENLDRVYHNIMPEYGQKVQIPLPIKQLCTKDILVMEFLRGEKFIDAIKKNFRAIATKAGMSYDELEARELEKVKRGEFMTLEEKRKQNGKEQFWLNVQQKVTNIIATCYNFSAGYFLGTMQYKESIELIDLADIISTISIVHGHQIMIDGFVNGDPHPGNVLLLDDGRIGLVDYGQVKHLNENFKEAYAELILALASTDGYEDVCDIALNKLNIKTKYSNKDVIFKTMKFWNDTNSVKGDLNNYEFINELNNIDPIIDPCDDLIIPSRVSVILRGIGNAFGIDISMAKLWEPIAEKAIKKYSLQRSK